MHAIALPRTRRSVTLLVLFLLVATLVATVANRAGAVDASDVEVVYVADGYNFPDALVGATVATLNGAPMLGVRGTNSGDLVPPATAAELDRLTNDKAAKLKEIVILGGPAAVSAKVEAELLAWADKTSRLAGDDRFATFAEISAALPTSIKQAENADMLDGMDATDFVPATDADGFARFGEDGDIFTYLVEMKKGDAPVVFAEIGPLRFTAKCQDDAGQTRGIVEYTSTVGPWFEDAVEYAADVVNTPLTFATAANTPAYDYWYEEIAVPGPGVYIADDGYKNTVFLEHGTTHDCVFAGTLFPIIRGNR